MSSSHNVVTNAMRCIKHAPEQKWCGHTNCQRERCALNNDCFGHVLNLAVADIPKHSKVCQDAQEILRSLSLSRFHQSKMLPSTASRQCPKKKSLSVGSIRLSAIIIHTRWTVQGIVIDSFLEQYQKPQDKIGS